MSSAIEILYLCHCTDKKCWFADTVLWLCPSQLNIKMALALLPILMQESFWWWLCSVRCGLPLPQAPLGISVPACTSSETTWQLTNFIGQTSIVLTFICSYCCFKFLFFVSLSDGTASHGMNKVLLNSILFCLHDLSILIVVLNLCFYESDRTASRGMNKVLLNWILFCLPVMQTLEVTGI